jgi:1,4-dihydroxy-2-naphthoyl-CoA synthase
MSVANATTLPVAQANPQHFRLAVSGKRATITLDRPEKKNPLTFESYRELTDLFLALQRDDAIKAIVVTGAPGVARLVRSLTLDIKTRDYIRAAETRGESKWHIMLWEALPVLHHILRMDRRHRSWISQGSHPNLHRKVLRQNYHFQLQRSRHLLS